MGGVRLRPAASASDPELDSLRAEVDRMDDALLALIERRLTVTAAMTAAKQEGPWLLLRPAREASILRRLEARAPHVPAALIRRIWRELMGHCRHGQRPTALLIHSRDPQGALAAARERFGSIAPARFAGSANEALSAALSEEAVAVVDLGAWDGIREPGFAVIERLAGRDGRILAVAVGRIAPEERTLP